MIFIFLSSIAFIYIYLIIRPLYSSNTKIKYYQKDNNPENIMIVAHPDDETLFGYSDLIEGTWLVICVTGATVNSTNWLRLGMSRKDYNKQRIDEFSEVMKKFNHSYEIWDFEDNLFSCNWDSKLLDKSLLDILQSKNWNKIVTHNSHGEYGHIQHKGVYEFVKNISSKLNFINRLNFFDEENILKNKKDKKFFEYLKIYSSQKKIIKKFL